MKLAHVELKNTIDIKPNQPSEWIVEAPEVFAKYVQELLNQKNGADGNFTFSADGKICDISKRVEVILNPFAVDINEKRIINKLYTQLGEIAYTETFYMQTQEVLQQIYQYVLKLEHESRHILSLDEDIDLNALFKAMGVRHEVFEGDFFETLCRYMKVVCEVLGIKLIICINLRSYLTDEQMESLITDINYADFGLLLIENQERSCLQGVSRCIIDRDLCEI